MLPAATKNAAHQIDRTSATLKIMAATSRLVEDILRLAVTRRRKRLKRPMRVLYSGRNATEAKPSRRHAMKPSLPRALLLLLLLPPAPALSQTSSSKINFRDDVLPLLKEHCVSCHGPTQQMNGFRLDRRAAALKGGTITVLVPGNSAASRLYLKL